MLPQTIHHSFFQSNHTSICLLSHATVWPIGRREAHRPWQQEKDEAKCRTVVRLSKCVILRGIGWWDILGLLYWNEFHKQAHVYIYIHVPLLAKSGGRVNSLDNNITSKAPLTILTLLFLLACNPSWASRPVEKVWVYININNITNVWNHWVYPKCLCNMT